MSRIDDLITELCPDGVEFQTLGSLLVYEQPTKYLVESAQYDDSHSTPVLTAGQTFILGYTDEPDGVYPASSGEPVIIFDDFTTAFRWVDFRFKAKSSAMKMLRPRSGSAVDFRFVYYAMLCIRFKPNEHARHWISQYSTFRIPVPPLEVQREIVRVLDTFTELEAELEAELETRRRQYAHYRDTLLSFDETISRVPLGDLLREPLVNGRSVPDGDGYPVLRLTALHGPTVDTSERKLGRWDRQAGSRFRIEAGDILVVRGNGSRDLIARACMVEGTEEIAFPDTMIRVRPSLDVISQRFLFYVWESRDTRVAIERAAKVTSGVWKVSQADLSGVVMPVPPLAEQERIVAILDQFDALVNDLSVGLPAELAARRKQYEHYRDRLLTFKELAA